MWSRAFSHEGLTTVVELKNWAASTMKPLGRIVKTLTAGILVVVVILFALNYYVQVSDRGSSHGIVEEWLFRRSAQSALTRSLESENLRRYNDSASLGGQIVAVLNSSGARILTDATLRQERTDTAAMARAAHEMASKIPEDYLAASNPELAKMYVKHFVPAMQLWSSGLAEGRQELVVSGIDHYNTFLAWIQSKPRSDFKSMR